MRFSSVTVPLDVLAENECDSVTMLQISQVSKSIQCRWLWYPTNQLSISTHGDSQFGNRSFGKQVTSINDESETKQRITEAKSLSRVGLLTVSSKHRADASGTANSQLVACSKVDLLQYGDFSGVKV